MTLSLSPYTASLPACMSTQTDYYVLFCWLNSCSDRPCEAVLIYISLTYTQTHTTCMLDDTDGNRRTVLTKDTINTIQHNQKHLHVESYVMVLGDCSNNVWCIIVTTGLKLYCGYLFLEIFWIMQLPLIY